jgi:hypothetical protein
MWAKIAIFFAKLERLFWIGSVSFSFRLHRFACRTATCNSPASLAGADPDQRRKN